MAAEHSRRSVGLDVLRVAATACVLLSHFGAFSAVHWGVPHADLLFVPGPLGLAAFFVLSGYLIGGLLLRIVDAGVDFRAWRGFTVRRLLRVLPTYLLWLGVLACLDPLATGIGGLLRYATLTQNLAWPMPQGNWFGVSWSLAIEVWFYLAFGALALGAAAWRGRRGLYVVLAAFLLLPLLARACMPIALPWDAWIRKIAVLRLDAIASGVLVAVVMQRSDWLQRHRMGLAVAGTLLLLGVLAWWCLVVRGFALHAWFARTFVFDGLQLGVALLLPALLHLQPASARTRTVWAWWSDATYAIYLVHLSMLLWALQWVQRGLLPFVPALLLALAVTLAWAAFSLHAIERPIRRWRLQLAARARTVAAAASL
jgi:peptidoglycan/LPS O-acetylase OafA/YrhL